MSNLKNVIYEFKLILLGPPLDGGTFTPME